MRILKTINSLLFLVLFGGCALYGVPKVEKVFELKQVAWPIPKYAEFSYERNPVNIIMSKEWNDTDAKYDIYQFSFNSNGENGQQANLVSGRYIKSRQSGKNKLIIILPIYGGDWRHRVPGELMAKHLTDWNPDQDSNVLLLDGQNDIFYWGIAEQFYSEKDFLEEVRHSTVKVKNTIIDVRRLIDWAEIQPEIDKNKIGIIGFSIGAVVASSIMGIDERISAGVFAMGGGNLHEIFSYTNADFMRNARVVILKKFGWTEEILAQKIESVFQAIEPVFYAKHINPANVLLFEAEFDDYIPKSSRDRLWESMGKPTRIKFPFKHKATFLFSSTILGFDYLEFKAADFLNKVLQ